jgi:hypothetical protein
VGVAGRRFALRDRASVRRGEVVKLQSGVDTWSFRRPGGEVGDARAAGSRLATREWTSFGSSPGVPRSRGVGNSPSGHADAGANGATRISRCGRACSSKPREAGSQRAFGLAPIVLVDRQGSKPHGCLSGETNRRGPGRRKPSRGCETLKAERLRERQTRDRCAANGDLSPGAHAEKRTPGSDSAEGDKNLRRGAVRGTDSGLKLRRTES